MSKQFRPILACNAPPLSELRYPLLASPKLDGIRCIVRGGRALTRSLKPVPNHYIRAIIEAIMTEGVDGEILSGGSFRSCTSAVMSPEGLPEFTFNLFDYFDENHPGRPYEERMSKVESIIRNSPIRCAVGTSSGTSSGTFCAIPARWIRSASQMLDFENQCLAQGHEGVIARAPEGLYKFGRSTTSQGWMLKIKRIADAEAEIVGFRELMVNQNEATVDALGKTKRSTAKDGMVGGGTLGSLVVRGVGGTEWPEEFGLGSGFDADTRALVWANQKEYLGKLARYKYKPYGSHVRPREPIFAGFRDELDL